MQDGGSGGDAGLDNEVVDLAQKRGMTFYDEVEHHLFVQIIILHSHSVGIVNSLVVRDVNVVQVVVAVVLVVDAFENARRKKGVQVKCQMQ